MAPRTSSLSLSSSPNDYFAAALASSRIPVGLLPLTCSDLRPVGGCLSRYLPAWRRITDDPWVLGVLKDGYAPQFTRQRPSLTKEWWRYDSIKQSTPPDRRELLKDHIQELLAKQAIEEVRDKGSLGYYSHMFLTPKKNGKLRPIIDLTCLNDFLVCPKFKMESSVSVAAAVQPHDWGSSLDLTDAYFHVPVATSFRKYLRIVVGGKVYQYCALPFGLSTSPLVFSQMLDPVAIFLHSRGISLHRYLDDFLIRSQSRSLCHLWTQLTLQLLFFLGWGVSLEKSDLDPSQEFQYIGVLFRTLLGIMVPPEDRVANIRRLASLLLESRPQARDWATFIGLLSSAERQVPFGRLRIRPIQQCLSRQFSWGLDPGTKEVLPDAATREAVRWWSDPANLLKGMPLGPFQPDVSLYTDACEVGWGAHAQDFQASGTWSPLEDTLFINAKELLAVLRAFECSPERWRNKKVLVALDNSTAVSYINKQGGTRSPQCLRITYQLYQFVQDHGMVIRARHIPGVLNRLADLLSRGDRVVQTEWTLDPRVAHRIFAIWGRPHLDLMAIRLSAQLPTFVSPVPDDLAFAVDAMSLSWDHMDAYVFPPWPMIQGVLTKAQLHQCLLTAVLPRWPNSPWFPLLLRLLIDHPRKLPHNHDLITMPHNGLLHGSIRMLDLHVCRLSSNPALSRAFLEQSRKGLPRELDGTLPTGSTTPSGRSFVFGAINGVLIHSLSL